MADLLSAISVLLVFLTFLLNTIENEVSKQVALRKPDKAQIETRKQFNNGLLKLLFLKALPVTLIFLVTLYSLIPKAVHIINISSFSLWDFDELNTIFLFIELGLLGLTIYAILKIKALVIKIKEDT